MFHYVIMCITAFMCIYGRNAIISYQPVPPFSVNFLQEAADSNNIVEPEAEDISVRTREPSNEEKKKEENSRCSTDEHPLGEPDIKRELGKVGKLFINRYFDDGRFQARHGRDFQAVQDTDEEDIPKDSQREGGPKSVEDEQFLEEQSEAVNITNATKILLEQIENPYAQQEQEAELCCDEEDHEKEEGEGKTKIAPKGTLEMHFYKHTPGSGKSSHKKKPVVIKLYPTHRKSHSGKNPKKFDYVALLTSDSQDTNFKKVPAVKLEVVPVGKIDRFQRKTRYFTPFYIAKYRKRTPYLSYDPNDNLYHILENAKFGCHHSTHVPILFINTIPKMTYRYNNDDLLKRSPPFDLSDNKYLREADGLIQNVRTFLKMDFPKSEQSMNVDGSVLVNPRFLDNQELKSSDKQSFRNGMDDKDIFQQKKRHSLRFAVKDRVVKREITSTNRYQNFINSRISLLLNEREKDSMEN